MYHVTYHVITQLLCIVAGSGNCMVVHPPSPEASESDHFGGSTGLPEWQLLDWDSYDFKFQDGAGGVGGGGGRGADPYPTMLDGLPGFIAEDIAALLRYLPRALSRQRGWFKPLHKQQQLLLLW